MAQRELLKWAIVDIKRRKRSDGSECERAIAEVDRKLTKRKDRHKKAEIQDCRCCRFPQQASNIVACGVKDAHVSLIIRPDQRLAVSVK